MGRCKQKNQNGFSLFSLHTNSMKNQDSSELTYFLKGIRDSLLVLGLVGLCLFILYSVYY